MHQESKKYGLIIAIVIVVILLAVSAYFVWSHNQDEKDDAPESNQSQISGAETDSESVDNSETGDNTLQTTTSPDPQIFIQIQGSDPFTKTDGSTSYTTTAYGTVTFEDAQAKSLKISIYLEGGEKVSCSNYTGIFKRVLSGLSCSNINYNQTLVEGIDGNYAGKTFACKLRSEKEEMSRGKTYYISVFACDF